MNNIQKEYQKAYVDKLVEKGLCEIVYISKEEYDAAENKDNYRIEPHTYDISRDKFYKIINSEISDADINKYLTFVTLDTLETIDSKINTLRRIMIFTLILTLICFMVVFYKLSNIQIAFNF